MILHEEISIERHWLEAEQYDSGKNRKVLSDLKTLPFCILHGSAGSGKTTDIGRYCKSTDNAIEKKLKFVDDEHKLEEWIKDAYRNGDELFLDGFDEKQDRFSGKDLCDIIGRHSHQLPRIRLITRSSHIDEPFIERLKNALRRRSTNEEPTTDAPVQKFRLLELSKDEAEYWIRRRLGTEAEAFLSACDEHQLLDLFDSPIDLDGLIEASQEPGFNFTEPGDVFSILVRKNLAEHPDRSRNLNTTLEDRLLLAQIIGLDQSINGIDAVKLSYSQPSVEPLFEAFRHIKEEPAFSRELFTELYQETIGSSLFESASGAAQFRSAAKQQFLAAQILQRSKPEDIIKRFTNPETGTEIPTRAQEVFTEVAAHHESVFSWLLTHQPKILLHSVNRSLSPERRKAVVHQMLEGAVDSSLFGYGDFRHLKYRKVTEDIGRTLHDPNSKEDSLFFATCLAWQFRCVELASLLADRLSNPDSPYMQRVYCAKALELFGPHYHHHLEPLLGLSKEDDPSDYLIGCALRCLWPHALKAEQVFDCLREPKDNFGSDYSWFLSSQAPSEDLSQYIEIGLTWLTQRDRREDVPHRDRFEELEKSVVVQAWNSIDYSDSVTLAFATYLVSSTKYFTVDLPFRRSSSLHLPKEEFGLAYEDFVADSAKRFKLVSFFLQMNRKEENEKYWYLAFLLRPSNLAQVVDFVADYSEIGKDSLVKYVEQSYLEIVYRKEQKSFSSLKPAMQLLGIDVAAVEARARHFRRKDQARRRRYHRPIKPDFDYFRFLGALKGWIREKPVDSRELDVLCNLWVQKNGHFDHQSRFENLEVWSELTFEDKNAVQSMAMTLLQTGPEASLSAEGIHSWEERVGIASLLLIQDTRPDWIEANWSSVLRWLPYLSYSSIYLEPEQKSFQPLLDKCSTQAKTEYLRQFATVFGAGQIEYFERHDAIWSDSVGESVLELIFDRSTGKDAKLYLCLLLAVKERSLPEYLLTEFWKDLSFARIVVRTAVSSKITILGEITSSFARRSKKNYTFVLDVLKTASVMNESFLAELDTDLLVRLYHDLQPGPNEMEETGISWGRSTLTRYDVMNTLIWRADDSTLAFLASDQKFSYALSRAWQNRVDHSWQKPELSEVILLILGKIKVIRTLEDLHQFVLEELQEIGHFYIEALDAAWKIDEPDISKIISWLLNYRNQSMRSFLEAEIGPKYRTDIIVSTTQMTQTRKSLQTIIEVKKKSNDEWSKAIGDQLVERYLCRDTSKEATGVYLLIDDEGTLSEEDEIMLRKICDEAQPHLVSLMTFRPRPKPATRSKDASRPGKALGKGA